MLKNKFQVDIKDMRNVFLNGEKLKRKYNSDSLRKIFVGKEYIIKIEIFEDDWKQCKNEYRLWKRILKKHRKYFVPVLYYQEAEKYDYIIEPKLNLVKCLDTDLEDIIWDTELRAICRKYGLIDLHGRLNENWFIIHGRPIITDYGV